MSLGTDPPRFARFNRQTMIKLEKAILTTQATVSRQITFADMQCSSMQERGGNKDRNRKRDRNGGRRRSRTFVLICKTVPRPETNSRSATLTQNR